MMESEGPISTDDKNNEKPDAAEVSEGNADGQQQQPEEVVRETTDESEDDRGAGEGQNIDMPKTNYSKREGAAPEVIQIVVESEDGTETAATAALSASGAIKLIELPGGTAILEEGGDQGNNVTVGEEAGGETAEEETTTTLATVVDNDGVTYTYVPIEEQDVGEINRKESDVEGAKDDVVAMTEITVTEDKDVEEGREGKQTAEMTMTTTLLVDDPPPLYLLQSHPAYKWDLLHSILDLDASGCALDYPVFCADGVAWSSRLLLAAISPMLNEALAGAELGGESCLVLPEVTRAEFTTFSRALFAQKGDKSLDFLILIKIAETLGAHITMTCDFPPTTDDLPVMDYRGFQDNPGERGKVFRSLGYDAGHFNSSSFSDKASNFSTDRLDALCSVLRSDVECPICKRTFVDEEGLKKHHATLHVGKHVRSLIRPKQEYECETCHKTFSLSVNVRKHKWLCHRRVPRAVVVADDDRALDRAAAKLRKAQERYEDMICGVCGMEAVTWKQLRIHMLDHSKERPYKCEQCGKGFKEKQKLDRHTLVHTGEKSHVCPICTRAFSLKHNLKSHLKIHEGRGAFCRYCGKMYSQSKNLTMHESTHANMGHRMTQDKSVQQKQKLRETGKGRKSLLEMDKMRKGGKEATKKVGRRKK